MAEPAPVALSAADELLPLRQLQRYHGPWLPGLAASASLTDLDVIHVGHLPGAADCIAKVSLLCVPSRRTLTVDLVHSVGLLAQVDVTGP